MSATVTNESQKPPAGAGFKNDSAKLPESYSLGEKEYASRADLLEKFSENMQATLTYCSVFLSFGMCVAVLGPTILDLGCQTGSKQDDMSWVFFTQAAFTLLGSMIGGLLIHRVSGKLILLISTLMIIVTMAMVPLCDTLWLLAVDFVIMGIFMGNIDTIANVQLIKIYGTHVSPFLQALHFCYGLGAFISPLIAEPFILNTECTPYVQGSLDSSNITAQKINQDKLEEIQNELHVKYAYWTYAMVQVPIALLVLILMIRSSLCTETPHLGQGPTVVDLKSMGKDSDSENSEGAMIDCTDEPYKYVSVITIIVVASSLLFFADGAQAGFGAYIYTYGVKGDADMSSSTSAFLNGVFWGFFAFGRLISIAFATCLTPATMLMGNLLGSCFAIALMLCFRANVVVLFIGAAMYGLFLSSIYPSSIALTEKFVHITGILTSFLVIGAAAGEMTFPVIIAHVMMVSGTYSFFQILMMISSAALVLFIILWIVGTVMGQKTSEQPLCVSWCCRSCIGTPMLKPSAQTINYFSINQDDVQMVPISPQNSRLLTMTGDFHDSDERHRPTVDRDLLNLDTADYIGINGVDEPMAERTVSAHRRLTHNTDRNRTAIVTI